MKGENVIKDKTFSFAIDIVTLYKFLAENENEFILSKQLLRCGTSIGANVRESEFAQSKRDFISKMSISLKEANESSYWIELLYKTNYISEEKFHFIHSKVIEIIRLLVSIVKTSKNNS